MSKPPVSADGLGWADAIAVLLGVQALLLADELVLEARKEHEQTELCDNSQWNSSAVHNGTLRQLPITYQLIVPGIPGIIA
jgi:hypothetical protein